MMSMVMARAWIAGIVLTAACPAAAQIMTAEELLAKVDERVGALEPYRKLLNEPDPTRSIAAMEIMLGSGEPTLVRIATEFGLLSADPKKQRMAAEAILNSGVPLTIALDGGEVEDKAEFNNAVKRYHDGAVSPDGIAYISVPIGSFDAEKGCYLRPSDDRYCNASINGDGIFVTAARIQARLGYGPDGVLTGAGAIHSFEPSLAAQMKILE